MKITCQSCQAKYTIADEKVAGKTVKIKCKKCGATIVVSGSDGAGQGPIASSGAAGAPLAAPPGDDDEGDGATRVFTEGVPGGGNDEWTVNVTDEDQRTLTAAQILYEYQRGVVTDDTYMWKDGMADWLPLSGVPELMRLVAGRGSAPAPRPAAGMPVAAPAPVAAAIPAMPPGGLGGTMMMTEPAASPFAAASPAAVAASAAARPASNSRRWRPPPRARGARRIGTSASATRTRCCSRSPRSPLRRVPASTTTTRSISALPPRGTGAATSMTS